MRIRAAAGAGRRGRGGARAKRAVCRKVQKIGGAVDLREKFFSVKKTKLFFVYSEFNCETGFEFLKIGKRETANIRG